MPEQVGRIRRRRLDRLHRCHPVLDHESKLRSEEHTSELQSRLHLVCRLLLEKKKTTPVQSSLFRLSLRELRSRSNLLRLTNSLPHQTGVMENHRTGLYHTT